MSHDLSFVDAKAWAKQDPENREWQNRWQYGGILRGVGRKGGQMVFDWGPDATQQQKEDIENALTDMSKWGTRIEAILDDPPSPSERGLLKKMKKWRRP